MNEKHRIVTEFGIVGTLVRKLHSRHKVETTFLYNFSTVFITLLSQQDHGVSREHVTVLCSMVLNPLNRLLVYGY